MKKLNKESVADSEILSMHGDVKLDNKKTSIKDYYNDSYELTDRTSIARCVPVKYVLNVPHTTVNREFESRVPKQSKNFEKKAESAREITIFNVMNDITVSLSHGTFPVPKGFSIGDGNTRSEYLRQLKDDIDAFFSNVTVKFVKIYTAEQYMLEYDSYDAKTSTETSPHKITGAVRAFGIDLRTPKAKKGQFGESIRYAYPGDSREEIFAKVKYFHKELEMADKHVFHVDDKKLRVNASKLISAFLIAQKLYSEPSTQYQQLTSMMKKLSTITENNWQILSHPNNPDNSRFDGAQLIMREAINGEHTEKGTAGGDYANALDFYLFCIELWMKPGDKGFRKQIYAKDYAGYFRDAKDTLADRDFSV
jgi:hypothetical protein